ncbi:GntR family transcriptional regulator [Bacillus sp. OxB-1]|uniref:GntR family transcriptional regulator n=1 Tax=Bacillus sp. (strain OxB-1) TaxID=98228 RepID=UPI000581F754|nr:GntR family transcriptional regulator [Bacillus sp. OxB-1]BAQ11702.1 GntR family transcriptional regulator [Bacillus sp. OxB-1]
MLIRIDPDSETPIYLQLANQLIELAARGNLRDGDPLPSVRSLAADLGMNMHTVNKAYHALEKKGIITIVPKSGAVLNTIQEGELSSAHRGRIEEEMRPIVAEALVLGMKFEEIQHLLSEIHSNLKEE